VNALSPVQRKERRRQRRRHEVVRWSVRILVVALVFAIGVALGQAIQDNPRPGQTVTYNRTLHIPTSGNQGSTITP
jgi:hypothetical protein